MGLSIRDLERVADELAAQPGVRVKPTKKGYICFPPNDGPAFSWHSTPSDTNQGRQLARDIRRAGLVIPLVLPLTKRTSGE